MIIEKEKSMKLICRKEKGKIDKFLTMDTSLNIIISKSELYFSW